MSEIILYGARACPFVHRTRLVLLEKRVDFEWVEIDLRTPPEWFFQLSPYGKVPVLKYGEDLVWESTIINEYLDEVFPEPPLLPAQPSQRAWARFWIDFANTKFVPWFYKLLLEQRPEKQAQRTTELAEHLLFLENAGLGHANAGSYWLDEQLSLVDLAFYPFFERLCVLEYYRHFTLPTACSRLSTWWKRINQRDTVRQLQNPAEYYLKAYAHYADGSAAGSTVRDMQSA